MILSFSKEKFVEKILSGEKTFTLRHDTNNRWRGNMPIQFWYGNPRNMKRNPDIRHFANGVVGIVRKATVIIEPGMLPVIWTEYGANGLMVQLTGADMEDFIRADGFGYMSDFINFHGVGTHNFKGIYWKQNLIERI